MLGASKTLDEVARNGAFQDGLRPEVFLGAPCILSWPAAQPSQPFVIPNRAEGPVRACPEPAEGNLLYRWPVLRQRQPFPHIDANLTPQPSYRLRLQSRSI